MIFFVGIKGVAMANLAVFLKRMGKKVFGADTQAQFITDELLKNNKIKWIEDFDPKHLKKDVDLVVYSGVHGGTRNPIVVEAKKRKIKVICQAELQDELMKQFAVKIAVAGCHGKTTTSSLLVYALDRLKTRPSYLIGAPYFDGHEGANFQAKKYFVIEADEYGVNPPYDLTPKFHKLNPDYIIGLNIDFDHPDVYRDIKETKTAFVKFFATRKLLLCADDKNLMSITSKFKKSRYKTYGFGESADYRIVNWRVDGEESSFEIKAIGKFKVNLFGEKNIANAASVIVLLHRLGFKPEAVAHAILGFYGAKRRFERVYYKNNIYLYDDYAHHPNEIVSTIEAARLRFKGRRIVIIFQPHTYSRTAFLLKEFTESLSKADLTLILPIFASARETKYEFKITSNDIVNGAKTGNLHQFKNSKELLDRLRTILRRGDVVFTMGAGDVYKLGEKIIKIIQSK